MDRVIFDSKNADGEHQDEGEQIPGHRDVRVAGHQTVMNVDDGKGCVGSINSVGSLTMRLI